MRRKNHEKLQGLAISMRVPAWSVLVEYQRPPFETENREHLILLSRTGQVIECIDIKNFASWEKIRGALRKYALTDECQKDWIRYEKEELNREEAPKRLYAN